MSAEDVRPFVSVVVPARDAERTIAVTLDSLIAQTDPRWEALIVDDDSSDGTRSIAAAYAESDPRFRVFSSVAHSEGGARNVGIAEAVAPWLLFLDADDLIESYAIECAAGMVARYPDADGVVFSWVRFSEEGVADPQHWDDREDQFEVVASHTPFPIHACVIKRTVVMELGMFNASLQGVADWDLWQRVFRSGARLVRVGYTAARYRIHASTMSRDARAMFEQSRIVIRRGHAADPRVGRPVPRYAEGAPAGGRPLALVRHACWWGGIAIATDQDALSLLDSVENELRAAGPRAVSPEFVGLALEESIRLPSSSPPEEWPALWASVVPAVRAFLARLEEQVHEPGLAWKAERLLDVPSTCGERTMSRRGPLVAVDVELTSPLRAIEVGEDVEQILCVGRLDGRALGLLELPATDRRVDADVLADAAVDRWFWDLLRRSLARRSLVRRGADGAEIYVALVHDLWPQPSRRRSRVRVALGVPVEVIAGDDLPRILGVGTHVEVATRVGGRLLAPVRIAAADARRRTRLRHALTLAGGVDLLRAVANEVLIGRTVDEPLHRALASAARTDRA